MNSLDAMEIATRSKELHDPDGRYRQLVEAVNGVLWEYDIASNCFTFVSQQGVTLTGFSLDEWYSPGFWVDHIHPDDQAWAVNLCVSASARGEDHDFEYRMLCADGSYLWVRDIVRVYMCDGSPQKLHGLMIDITDRKSDDTTLLRLNRALRTLSAGNEALVRAESEAQLYANMCDVVVQAAGYTLAWIGLREYDDSKTVRPINSAGTEKDYIANTCFSWSETAPEGHGPTGRAIRTGTPQIFTDIAADPRMSPWHKLADKHSLRSGIAVPLMDRNEAFACLTLYSSEPNSVSSDEIGLFVDLAKNISYGIQALRDRNRREDAEAALLQTQKLDILGQLASSIAHDFNNLLGAIGGFAQFIEEDAPEGSTFKTYANRISTATKRSKSLVDQILSFTRSEDRTLETFFLHDLVFETRNSRQTRPHSSQSWTDQPDADQPVR